MEGLQEGNTVRTGEGVFSTAKLRQARKLPRDGTKWKQLPVTCTVKL
jgi:hypothetical protein